MRGEEMLRKSCTRRNAGLRRRAPPRPAVPRCQPARRRSRNTTGTDDGAALAARPRPGGQEGGAEQRHRRAAVLCTRLGRSRRQISPSPRAPQTRARSSSIHTRYSALIVIPGFALLVRYLLGLRILSLLSLLVIRQGHHRTRSVSHTPPHDVSCCQDYEYQLLVALRWP